MSRKNILVTGGAGFIGSNLVRALLQDERVGVIRILDNLSTGSKANINEFLHLSNVEFIEADIRDIDACLEACSDIHVISHQAALGSVPRSIKDPITTNAVNISGTLNIFHAAIANKIDRVIFAASSSTYGDSIELPKKESNIGSPLSPYAVTKYVNELYAQVLSTTYDFRYIGLRYFNVFGPNQDPDGPYAAVIPLFIKAALTGIGPTINGDGSNSRDFTYVDNAVQANLLSIFTANTIALNQVYNVACGQRTTLNDLWGYIKNVSNSTILAQYGPERLGDIPHSHASIAKASEYLKYIPRVNVEEGISKAYEWYTDNL